MRRLAALAGTLADARSAPLFVEAEDKRIRRGVFKSVPDLKAAIAESIAVHNAKPKPFIWTAKANDILAKVTRARAILNKNTSS